MEGRKSLLQKMMGSSANTKQDDAVFQFLRDVEMLDREWGEKFDALRQAKEGVVNQMRGNVVDAVRTTMEVLYDMLSSDVPESVQNIIKLALKKGRAVVDVIA